MEDLNPTVSWSAEMWKQSKKKSVLSGNQNMTEADLRAESERWLNIYRQRHKHVGNFEGNFEAGLGRNIRVVANAQMQAKIYISCHIGQPAGTDFTLSTDVTSEITECYALIRQSMHAQVICMMRALSVMHMHSLSALFGHIDSHRWAVQSEVSPPCNMNTARGLSEHRNHCSVLHHKRHYRQMPLAAGTCGWALIIQKKTRLERSSHICRLLLSLQNWQPSNPEWNAAVPLAVTHALPLLLPQTLAVSQNTLLHVEAFALGQNTQLLLWESEIADAQWQQGNDEVYVVQRILAGRGVEEAVGGCKGKNGKLIVRIHEKPQGGAVGAGQKTGATADEGWQGGIWQEEAAWRKSSGQAAVLLGQNASCAAVAHLARHTQRWTKMAWMHPVGAWC